MQSNPCNCYKSHINSPSTSTYNPLLIKKSVLKPIPQTKTNKKTPAIKTPFDYWLTQNKILDNDRATTDQYSTTDEWSSAVSKRKVEKKFTRKRKQRKTLKYFDEHFREVNPDLPSSISNPELTTPITKVIPERDLNVSVFKSQSSIDLSTNDSDDDVHKIKIRLIQQSSYNKQLMRTLSFDQKRNALYVSREICTRIGEHDVPTCLREGNYQEGLSLVSRNACHTSNNLPYLNGHQFKFLFKNNMSDHNNRFVPPEQIYERVVDWLSSNDFQKHEVDSSTKSAVENEFETNIPDYQSDITSITKVIDRQYERRLEDAVNESNEVPKTTSEKTVLTQDSSDARLQAVVEKLKNNVMVNSWKKITNLSSWQLYNKRIKNNPKPPSIPAILEKDELVCFPLYTFTPLLLIYLLYTNYNEYLIYLLFCPY